MKKTLITLAALAVASVAQAAYLEENFSGVDSAFTLKITLDWDAAISSLGDWSSKSTITAYTGSAHWWPLGITLFKGHDGDADHIYAGFLSATNDNTPAHVNPTQGSGASMPGDKANIEFTPESYKNTDGELVLYVAYDPTADQFSITSPLNNGLDSTWAYISTTQELSSNDYKWLEVSAPDGVVKSIETYNYAVPVPEPATATLSLLALAGLAARRRRK